MRHHPTPMTDGDLIKLELMKFGLSPYQCDIYLLLIKTGDLRVQEIVAKTGIARTSVYDCLSKLFELGIIEEVIHDKYKKIRAYSIGTMRHGLEDEAIRIQRLTRDLDELEKTIKQSVAIGKRDNFSEIRVYKNRSGARQLFWNSLKTDDVVYVMSDWGRGRYVGMKFYSRFVDESRRRGIKERVIMNPTKHAIESIRRYTYPGSPTMRTPIESIGAIDPSIFEVSGDTLMYGNIYAHVYLKSVRIHGFEVESAEFAQMQRKIHESLWKMTKPITDYL